MKQIKRKIFLSIILLVVIKVSSQSPSLVWTKGFGVPGSGAVWNEALSVSPNGASIISVGYFTSIADFDPGPVSFTMNPYGTIDSYIVKLDASGNFVWSKQIGGTSSMVYSKNVQCDKYGNIYLLGSFNGTVDFDPSLGTYTMTSFGSHDIFITKFTAAGNFIFAKQIGGLNYDYCRGLAVDSANNIFLAGGFSGLIDFNPGISTYTLSSTGADDNFILKLDSIGNFIWVKSFGNGSNEGIRDIKLDNQANIYCAGFLQGTNVDFDPGPGIYTLSAVGGNSTFFSAKFDSSGQFKRAGVFGGGLGSEIAKSYIDKNKNMLVCGSFEGMRDFDPGIGSFTLSSFGSTDAFVTKFDSLGNFIWAKKIGGVNADVGKSIAIDSVSNIYVTGIFNGLADFDPDNSTSYNLSSSSSTDQDMFISILDKNGNFIWATKFGDVMYDESLNCEIDKQNNFYIDGTYRGTIDFDPNSPIVTLISPSSQNSLLQKYRICNYAPLLNIAAGSSVICGPPYQQTVTVNAIGSGLTYTWFPIFTGPSISVSPSVTTVYSVTGTDSLSCRNTSQITISVTACTNIVDHAVSDEITLYPNPSSGLIHIDSKGNFEMKVFTLTGQLVFEKQLIIGENEVNLSFLNAGLYFVKFLGSEYAQTVKILIQ